VTDIAGNGSPLQAGQKLVLTKSPVFVAPVPADLLALAKTNAPKPFPWGGNYANASEVSCLLGATNTDKGITQRNPDTTEVVNKLDHSYRTSHRRNSEGIYAYFRVDPQFATFGTKDLEITIIARRADDAKEVGFDVCYESLKGYKVTGSRKSIPAGEAWNEYAFTVNDANFAGGWGWNFRTDIGGSPGGIAIREVRVRKTAAK
jgi:polysaccharide biosynthesis protein PslG